MPIYKNRGFFLLIPLCAKGRPRLLFAALRIFTDEML